MVVTFAERTVARRRAELLATAVDLIAQRGWSRLRMQPIADRVGVSRQTVYNEFGTKDGLVRALALHVADQLLDDAEAAILDAGTLTEAWEGALFAALNAADTNPLMAQALETNDDSGFVRQFVGERPIIEHAQSRLTPVFQAKWPDADTTRLDTAIEAAIRLTISHFLLPLHPPAEAAAQTAQLLAGQADRRVARGPHRSTRAYTSTEMGVST